MKKTLILLLTVFSFSRLLSQSLHFDGVNDYVQTNVNVAQSSNITFECWVLGNNAPSTTIGMSGPMYGSNFGILWNHNSSFVGSAYVQAGAGGYYAASFGTLNANTWYHLAATYDGTTLRAYKNGVLINETITSGGIFSSASPLKLGCHPSNGVHFFNGQIDEARVWSTTRTCQEINDYMNDTLSGNESGLLAYYQFNEGTPNGNNSSISTLYNKVSNSNDATLYGFTLNGSISNFVGNSPMNATVNTSNITLNSASGTDNQTVCVNTAINNITYSVSGATGATFSGLPTGVNGSYSSGIITISGTPTVNGTFNYTVTLTGVCGNATGTITVNPNNTITLSSASGTNNQTVCVGTAITNITYSITGATGATVTGLPLGVTGSYSSGTVTISGTPTATGTFNYTVTLTGGCGTATATGSITVNPNNTITLSSASGTNNQTVCVGTAITNITYSTTGATGATVTGLPLGVSGTYSSGTVTISGTPTATGTFNYTVTLTGGCGTTSATGSITVNPNNTITLSSASGTNNQTVCVGTAIMNITYNTTGATGATVTGLPLGVTGSYSSGTVTISGTPTATGTFNYTVTLTGGCGTTSATGSISVNPNNTIALSSASGTNNQTVCVNTAITNITYSTTNATGATFSGLPTGINGSYNSGTVTISGTPTVTGIFNYSITLTGGCGNVSVSGIITVNVCTGVEEMSAKSLFNIYPNPNNGIFTIQTEKGGVFELVDITGKVINSYTFTNSTHTIQENLPAGMYFIREKESGAVQKLVVE